MVFLKIKHGIQYPDQDCSYTICTPCTWDIIHSMSLISIKQMTQKGYMAACSLQHICANQNHYSAWTGSLNCISIEKLNMWFFDMVKFEP